MNIHIYIYIHASIHINTYAYIIIYLYHIYIYAVDIHLTKGVSLLPDRNKSQWLLLRHHPSTFQIPQHWDHWRCYINRQCLVSSHSKLGKIQTICIYSKQTAEHTHSMIMKNRTTTGLSKHRLPLNSSALSCFIIILSLNYANLGYALISAQTTSGCWLHIQLYPITCQFYPILSPLRWLVSKCFKLSKPMDQTLSL
jgi:hypothetical protein